RFKNCHSPEARRAIHALQKFHVGGFIFFNGHPADIRFWSNWLQRESRYPLLLGADLERGLHSVFSQGTILPHPLAFGAADDEQ
ncbi:MAG: hypothetical protein GWN16_01570, partial [Calditrichae bacterium]|nr:hypothetical protein [Calditrichia bacterium]